MPGPTPIKPDLDVTLQTELETLARRHTTPQQIVLRAKIVLLAQQGGNNQEIADQLDLSVHMARHWRKRWLACQDVPLGELSVLQRLADAPRPGAPPTISAEAYCQIMALACQPPEECGCPIAHWTTRELAETVIAQNLVKSISPRQVGRFLKRCGPQAPSQPLLAHAGRGSRQGPQNRSDLSVV